jgi:hypothetical protein
MRFAARAVLLLVTLPALAETGPQDAARRLWVEAFVERFRDEACGMHWAGNPVYPPCIAQLRWEAEREYAAQHGTPPPPAPERR